MNQQATYFIVIPAPVYFDKTISPAARILYGHISSLTNREGYCFATNKYLAEITEAPQNTVVNWIAELTKAGHIEVQIDKAAGNKRKIYLTTLPPKKDIGITENDQTYNQKTESTPYTVKKINDKESTPSLFQDEKKTLYRTSILTHEVLKKKFENEITAGIDLEYYQQVVSDWSDSSNTKRTANGWLATIRKFMRDDKEAKRLHMIAGTNKTQNELTFLNL